MANQKSHRPLNVVILYEMIGSPWGGGNQFLRALTSELARMGQRVTTKVTQRSEVILINGWQLGRGRLLNPNQVARLRRTGKMDLLGKILPTSLQLGGNRSGPVLIHRVDGVPEITRGRRSKADRVQPAVNRLTDHTIYQSDFCRTSFERSCGKAPGAWRLIYNGVSPDIFFPSLDVVWGDGPLRLIAASWSSNARKGFATLADISRLPGVELTFAGNWCPEVRPANVRLAGVLNSASLADLMRSSHAMIHAAWNEPCSNAIVEAMACGLPVIYRDSGGNKELAGEYGVPITDDLTDVLAQFRVRYADLREKVLADRTKFLIHRAAEEYLSMFRYAVENHRVD